MDAIGAIRLMSEHSGKSLRQASIDTGRSPSYLAAAVCRGSTPNIDTLVEVAESFGYEVRLASVYRTRRTIRLSSPWHVKYVYYRDGRPSRTISHDVYKTEHAALSAAEESGLDLDVTGHTIYVDCGDDD